jgi:CopG family transcriptional regulator, nickel-responsive regulator
MTRELVRFGVAMEPELLEQLDALATARACTRSELLRDLARNELARAATQKRVPAVAAVTLVYNHHVRLLSERLTEIQHELGEQVRSTMHVHLDHDNCIEVVVLRGRADQLAAAATRMLAIRGVTHGGVEMVTEDALAASRSHRHGEGKDEAASAPHVHLHDGRPHVHLHAGSEHSHLPRKKSSRKRPRP